MRQCTTSLARLIPAVLLALWSGAWATMVSAASITEVNTSYTVGTAGLVAIDPFTVSGVGAATVTLTDLLWPQALASLSFKLTDPAGDSLGTLTGAGSQTFNLPGAGTYFALAFGQAQPAQSAASLAFGSFGLQVNFLPMSPVALPSAALLLVSGLGLLAANSRRGWRRARVVATAPAA
jgi:hypothetical protein